MAVSQRPHQAPDGCTPGMLECMTAMQLAIRFTARQIEILDALAQSAGTNRSAVLKSLVDDAERAHIASLYAKAYPVVRPEIDAFGDLDAFRDYAEFERVSSRIDETSW